MISDSCFMLVTTSNLNICTTRPHRYRHHHHYHLHHHHHPNTVRLCAVLKPSFTIVSCCPGLLIYKPCFLENIATNSCSDWLTISCGQGVVRRPLPQNVSTVAWRASSAHVPSHMQASDVSEQGYGTLYIILI